MKLSLNKLSDNYIGEYRKDYQDAGLLKEVSMKEVFDRRNRIKEGSLVMVNENNRFVQFLRNRKCVDEKIVGLDVLIRNIVRCEKYLSIEEYSRIEDALKDGYFELESYIDDFATIVAFAKQKCFSNDTANERNNRIIDERKRRTINNFFVEMQQNETDIDQVEIKYREEGQKKKIVIDESILLKMLLYGFANKYYVNIEKFDTEHWEEELFGRIVEKTPMGSPGYTYSKTLQCLVSMYLCFIEKEKMFDCEVPKKYKYKLLGRLLTIAGLPKYSEEKPYVDEADYYYKLLSRNVNV